mgnify:CR=1 FL=1
MNDFLIILTSGLTLGGMYAVGSIALALVWGALGMLNMAQGALLAIGGYASFAVTQGLNVGLHRDFDLYDPDVYLDPEGRRVFLPTRNDREASRKAIQWLRGRKGRAEPFFLWLRYNAPH